MVASIMEPNPWPYNGISYNRKCMKCNLYFSSDRNEEYICTYCQVKADISKRIRGSHELEKQILACINKNTNIEKLSDEIANCVADYLRDN